MRRRFPPTPRAALDHRGSAPGTRRIRPATTFPHNHSRAHSPVRGRAPARTGRGHVQQRAQRPPFARPNPRPAPSARAKETRERRPPVRRAPPAARPTGRCDRSPFQHQGRSRQPTADPKLSPRPLSVSGLHPPLTPARAPLVSRSATTRSVATPAPGLERRKNGRPDPRILSAIGLRIRSRPQRFDRCAGIVAAGAVTPRWSEVESESR